MFPFDQAALPKLPVRKALLIVDFQNDFLSRDGPLRVSEPESLVDRTLALAKEFRKSGDIVWVCTEFEKARPFADENILSTDDVPQPAALAAMTRRRIGKAETAAADPPESDLEAFLSRGGSECVRSASGAQAPAKVRDAVGPRDTTFIKSHYSAFKSGKLLQLLRGKLITKLYICGSLANIGVHATAIDAAMYGYGITIVEDCCGYRSELRQLNAIQHIVDTTGCVSVQSTDVLGSKSVPRTKHGSPVPTTESGAATRPPRPKAASPSSSELHEQLASLKLNDPVPSGGHDVPEDSAALTTNELLEVDPEAQPPSQDTASEPDVKIPPGGSAKTRIPPTSAHQVKAEKVRVEDPVGKSPGVVQDPSLLEIADEHETSSDTAPPSDLRSATNLIAGKNAETGREPSQATMATRSASKASKTSEPLCEGDTSIVYDLLHPKLADGIFEKLKDEVLWKRMSHQGGEVPRLVAVQGHVLEDGSMPIYRHPSDESPPLLPFSPTVLEIKAAVEHHLGHTLNHALIQFYRDGKDYISEHSDKTLDIVKGSYIANVSLGAERTMVFRTKRQEKDPSRASSQLSPAAVSSSSPNEDSKRKIERAKLPHNSLCRVGLKTNMHWLHAIKQDKRLEKQKSTEELAFSGSRISLTFRNIGTFLDKDNSVIWGQGATSKTREQAHSVINGQSDEMIRMLKAFGTENHSTRFDWDKHYGKGFDVLHMSSSPRLFYSPDAVTNMRVRFMLAEYGINYAKGSMPPLPSMAEGEASKRGVIPLPELMPIKFVDNDVEQSTLQGDLAIMLYLDTIIRPNKPDHATRSQAGTAQILTRFQQGLVLLDKWRMIRSSDGSNSSQVPGMLRRELAVWESYAAEAEYLGGSAISLADFVAWPVLHDIVGELGVGVLDATKSLRKYYEATLQRDTVVRIIGAGQTTQTDSDQEKTPQTGEAGQKQTESQKLGSLQALEPEKESKTILEPKTEQGLEVSDTTPSVEAGQSREEVGQRSAE